MIQVSTDPGQRSTPRGREDRSFLLVGGELFFLLAELGPRVLFLFWPCLVDELCLGESIERVTFSEDV